MASNTKQQKRAKRAASKAKQNRMVRSGQAVKASAGDSASVEQIFNRIWRVASARPRLARFLVYWTVLTLGAMLAAASLAVSARVMALPLFGCGG